MDIPTATIGPRLDEHMIPHSGCRPKVAYIMSRFPKLTETFILYEMLAVEQHGVQVELYPLLRERATLLHPEAASLVERAHFQPLVSWPILRAHLHFLRRKPRAYFGALWTLLRATWGSRRYFVGALGFFPKIVYLAQLMAGHGITHVHAHFASHPAAAAFVIHRLVDIPYSFTAHGSDLHRDRHMLREKAAEAAFVVSISRYNEEIIATECGGQFRDKVLVVHCGVDTRVFQPCPEDSQREPSARPFTILCTGTMYEVKGHTYLIEACRLLRERGVDFVCHLVGDGPDRPALTKQVAQAELADRVHFHGRRTREEIAQLVCRAHVVVAPSVPTRNGRREGIPVVLMEAMSSGVPTVASNLSGIPELVEDGQTGLLVPPRRAAALADALQKLSEDEDLRHGMGRAGREKVLREFDLHTNAGKLAALFLAHGQPSKRPKPMLTPGGAGS